MTGNSLHCHLWASQKQIISFPSVFIVLVYSISQIVDLKFHNKQCMVGASRYDGHNWPHTRMVKKLYAESSHQLPKYIFVVTLWKTAPKFWVCLKMLNGLYQEPYNPEPQYEPYPWLHPFQWRIIFRTGFCLESTHPVTPANFPIRFPPLLSKLLQNPQKSTCE